MGFKRPDRKAHVTIADGEFAGLEMTLSMSVSMQEFIDFQENRFGDDATIQTQKEAMEWWASRVLLEWNLEEEDGTPVPTGEEGFMSLAPAMALEVIDRWRRAVTEVSAPLASPLTDGMPSRAPSTTRPGSRSGSRRRR